MISKFRTPGAERQARAAIEDRMAHSLAGWHGPHNMPSRCARAVWEKNHSMCNPSNFQHINHGSVGPPPHTTGSNMRISEFDWKVKDFAQGDLSLSVASETYSVELGRHGAVLNRIMNGKAVHEYPENVWVRISESAARAYYEIADVADIVVVRRSFEGQQIEQSGRTLYDRFGTSRYISDGKTINTSLRIIERKDTFVPGAEYFLPLFIPEDSAQFPKVFFAKTSALTINGIGTEVAVNILSSDTEYSAVFGLSGFIKQGHSFALIRGMHTNTIIDPRTGIPDIRYFEVMLSLDSIQRGFRLKPEYIVHIENDGFLRIQANSISKASVSLLPLPP